MTRCVWVDSRKAEGFTVTAACTAAGISTSTYYEWAQRGIHGPSQRDLDEAYLVDAIITIHRSSDGVYGSPTITAELRADGWDVNHKRVERLMRANGIVGVFKPAKARTTIPAEDNPPVPDLVKRDFDPGAPDRAWAGDITYIPTGEGWLYLASVLDLGSRKLLGYSMADHMRTELVSDALDMAIGARGGAVEGTIFHGDRGSQYLSDAYRQQIAEAGMRQSVGRTGVCWDNAVAESFWSSLKREVVYRYRFATRAQARRAIFTWINWYNTKRRHSTLGYISPDQWENQYTLNHPNSDQKAA
jgi:transposase InsO family protein